MRASPWIVLAGNVGATAYLAYALLFYGWKGVSAQHLLQTIASGAMGRAAFDDGWTSAVLGLVLHYSIVTLAARVFFAAATRWAWLREEPVTAGLLYGVVLYAFMNFVVLPLSAYPFPPAFPLLRTATGLLAHMVGVGLPISLITRRAHWPA
jgi:uncharacterized membrane protein YagU involved in acid resistance